MLDRIRRAALPASRTARATLLSVVAMAALIVGLLAMHATGSSPEHSTHVAPTSAAHHANPATDARHAARAEPEASIAGAGHAPADLGDCALMMLGCVMLVAAVAVLIVAAPGAARAVARAVDDTRALLRSSAPPRPPSLIALSISRT
ncbi:DUF6153 family protein [Agromyces sp. NPDC055658]